MPKSRNRKDHKKRLQRRKETMTAAQNKFNKMLQEQMRQQMEEMGKKNEPTKTEDVGELDMSNIEPKELVINTEDKGEMV